MTMIKTAAVAEVSLIHKVALRIIIVNAEGTTPVSQQFMLSHIENCFNYWEGKQQEHVASFPSVVSFVLSYTKISRLRLSEKWFLKKKQVTRPEEFLLSCFYRAKNAVFAVLHRYIL